ncbi:hypothetical protein WJX77_005064 [Trebouxia sp. C0004]
MPSRRALLRLAGAALLSSASAYGIALQSLSPTAELSVSIELNDATATQSSGNLPTRSPVDVTLYFPTNGVNPDLPWVMMMNGANCYSQDYTFLLSQLAGRGYLAVAPTQLHPKPPKFQSNDLMKDEEQLCDKDSIAIVTGSLVNDVHTLLTNLTSRDPSEQPPIPHITAEAQDAIKNVNLDSFVVVSHSAGAVTAIDMLTGRCKAEKQAAQMCGNYTAILDKDGNGALKGVLAYEGYAASGITVPDNTFLTYMAGQYNNQAGEKFQETKGECVQYLKLQAGNHYAITDWNPDTAPHQRSPCAAHIPADDPNFTTTREEQEERLVFIAQYTDAVIRAKLLGDAATANYVMHEVPSSPLVQAADISPGCFGATQQTTH